MLRSTKKYTKKKTTKNKKWTDRTLGQMVKVNLQRQNQTKKHTHTHSQNEKKEKKYKRKRATKSINKSTNDNKF